MPVAFYPFSASELREWAYSPESFKGLGQDAELVVAGLHNADVILACASDNHCPTQRFFINCVCLIVGEAMRGIEPAASSDDIRANADIVAFLRRAEKTGNVLLLEIVWRARALLDDPSCVDYEYWCCGGLVRELYQD